VTHGVRRIKDRDTSSGRQTRLVVGELKTPKSRRTLALTPEMVAMFRQHRVRQAEAQMAAWMRWQDHGLIFASEVGTPMDPENFFRSFSRLCQQAGLGHWHPHELRHSGASLMLAQGTPLHVVSDVLGHASVAITKDALVAAVVAVMVAVRDREDLRLSGGESRCGCRARSRASVRDLLPLGSCRRGRDNAYWCAWPACGGVVRPKSGCYSP
jgi:integrase